MFAALLALALAGAPHHKYIRQHNLGPPGAGGASSCVVPYSCDASNNLLTSMDLTHASWTAYGAGGSAAPTVSALTGATIDGQSVNYNRVQFAAVSVGGDESTVYANVSSGACKQIYCTYSIYLRSHSGASPATGNLPIGTAQLGGDGQGYQLCPFTSSWSRCTLLMPSQVTAGFGYFWIGYVFNQSGASVALDLDLALPKAEYGSGGATAGQCPSPLQDQTVTPHTGYVARNVAQDWGITTRDGAGMVRLPNGTLLLCGGWKGSTQAEWGNNNTTNQCYKSTDNGATWSVVLAHVDNPEQTIEQCTGGTCTLGTCVGGTCAGLPCGTGACAPRPRRTHSACFFLATVSGTTYVYQIGSDGFDELYNVAEDGSPPYRSDVWRSDVATEGATWSPMTLAAEWGATGVSADGGQKSRALHSCWADDSGNLYVASGQKGLGTGDVLQDAWKSTNGGTSWSAISNVSWQGRGTIGNQLPRFNGKTIIAFGEQYDTSEAFRVYFNDAWSFDDTNWTQLSANTGTVTRGYVNLLAWNSRLWALKGINATGAHYTVVSSADGACWRNERASAGYAEHAASVAISNDGGFLVITGSTTSTAVYKISVPP